MVLLPVPMMVSDFCESRRWGLVIPLAFSTAAAVFTLQGGGETPGGPLLSAGIYPAAFFAGFLILLFQSAKRKQEEGECLRLRKMVDDKNRLLSTLTHEIRTPLTVIQSTTDIMLEGRMGSLNETQQSFMESLSDNVRRVVGFSDSILADIKVEGDWFTVRLRPVDLPKIVKGVARQMEPFLSERNQKIRYSFPQLLSRPRADGDWIRQVLVNLVHNSSKHLNEGGDIIMVVSENEQGLVVSVNDNGGGIAMAERERVLDEFYQGGLYEESHLEGSGLGLAIVKRVIEAHGGKVYVSSMKDLGTTVSFTLPSAEAADVS